MERSGSVFAVQAAVAGRARALAGPAQDDPRVSGREHLARHASGPYRRRADEAVVYARGMRPVFALLLAACGGGGAQMTTHDASRVDASAQDASAAPPHLVAYISGNAPDIAYYDFDLATGALTGGGQVPAFAANPSYLAMTRTHLYAVSEDTDRVGAYAIDPASGALAFIDDVSSGGTGPAHVSVDRTGAFVFAANYNDGMVAVLPVRADGGVAAAVANPLAGANAHMILGDAANKFVFVPCKGADYIAQYQFDAATGALVPNAAPTVPTAAGAGPRHLAFAPNGAFAYLITENLSTLTAFAYDAATGRLSPLQTVSNRAPGATGTSTGAEVVVHPMGKFVYASNRGDNTISAFAIGADGKVALVGHVATGLTPRSFTIDPTGAWMLVANQDGNTVTTYAIDSHTGMPSASGVTLAYTKPSFVGIVAL